MSTIYIAIADHPDCSKPQIRQIQWKRQRLSTLKRRYAPDGADIAALLNGEDVDDSALRTLRTKPGDRILFVPRVGLFASLWTIGAWLLGNVAVPAAIAYGVSYLGGELFGQDLPESPSQDVGGRSFGFRTRSAQQEGGVIEQPFGTVMNHGTIIAKWTDVDDSGATSEILYILLSLGEGPTEGIDSSQVFINDRPSTDFTGVTFTERVGTLDQTVITDFEKTKIETRIGQQVTASGGPLTVTLPRKGFDDIEYTLEWGHGLWTQLSSGALVAGGMAVKVEVAEAGTESWSTLLETTITDGPQRSPLFKAYKASAQGFSADRTKQYKLKFTKVQADYMGNNRNDHLAVRSIRGVVDIAFTHPGIALVGVKALATASLSGDIDVKVIHQGKIVPTYNGSAWVYQYSHNRAWVTYAQLTQPVITGNGGGTPWGVDSYEGFDPSQIDTAFFYEWAQMCDDLVDDGAGGTEELMPCHHVFLQKGELWQMAHEVAQIGRAHLILQGTTLTGWIDKAWTGASDLITAENILPGTLQQQWTKQRALAGSVTVYFEDAAQGYKRIPLPIHNSAAGRYQNSISIEGIGLTTVGQASRTAWFALKRNELIREVNRFQMGKDAVRYKPGDVHPIQYRRPNWGTSYRVRKYASSDTLELDRTVVATAGDSLFVRAYDADTELVVTTEYTVASISGNEVTITGTIAIDPVYDDIAAIGSTTEIKDWRLTKIEWTGDNRFDVTVETYNSTLYGIDSDEPVIAYIGAAPVPVRNLRESYVTRGEVYDMITRVLPRELAVDRPEISNITWTDDTPDGSSVSWSATDADEALQIRYKGTTYEITAGNTSNRFIYWTAGSGTFSTTASESGMQTALEAGAWLVCVNNDGIASATQPMPNIWAGVMQAGTLTATLGIIGDLAVDTAQLAANAVEEAKIAAGAVTNTKIGNLAVDTAQLAASAVEADKIATNAVTGVKIASSAVDADKIAINAVEEAKIAAGAISEGKLAALSVSTAKIQAAAITAAQIGNLAVDTQHMAALAVEEAKIAAGAVTNTKIGNLAVDTAQLAASAVEEAKLANSAVTAAKIAANAVEEAKIAAAAISEGKLAALSVSTAKIQALAVTAAKIGNLAVDVAKIGYGTQAMLAHNVADRCVGFWKFDDNAADTVVADENGKYDGTASSNTSTMSITGKVGNALQFDQAANDWITFGDEDDFDFGTGDFAVAFWIKTPGDSTEMVVVCKYDGTTGWNVQFDASDSVLSITIVDSGGSVSNTIGSTSLTDDAWHFVVINFDRSGNATLYVDGISDGTLAISSISGSLNHATGLAVGRLGHAASRYLDGDLDQMMLFNGLLTEHEIIALWNNGTGSDHLSEVKSAAVGPTEIRELAVETLKIGDNAVTVPVSDYTAGSTTIGSSYTTVASASITPTGDVIHIHFTCTLDNTYGGSGQSINGIRILRDAVTIYEDSNVHTTAANNAVSIAATSDDTPAAGSAVTYYAQLKDVTTPNYIDAVNRSLLLLMVKK